MPKKATIHIQKIAPGPPATRALATPTILPVPMVAASAVHRDWNWEMDWSPASVCFVTCLSWKIPPTVFWNQCPIWDNWKNYVSTVIRIPVPTRSTSMGTPHTKPLTALFTFVMSSTITFSSFVLSGKRKSVGIRRCPRWHCYLIFVSIYFS